MIGITQGLSTFDWIGPVESVRPGRVGRRLRGFWMVSLDQTQMATPETMELTLN